jgi:hypothetical protein
MRQLIKTYKPRLLTAALTISLAASFLLTGNAIAAVATCYYHATSTVTDCNSVKAEDPTFNPKAGCYDIEEHPSGVSAHPVTCAAQNSLPAKPDPVSTIVTTPGGTVNLGDAQGKYTCGADGKDSQVKTTINFGCVGKGSGLLDLIFAIIRFLSEGAGIIIIGSMVFAGIQYTVSRGDPSASAAAIKRIQNTGIALLIYIFAFAILNYIVPAGLLK